MTSEKILYVYFRDKGKVKRIDLEDMTKAFYNSHRDQFFCPNPNCDAQIEYCEGDKLPPYYRTKKSRVDGQEIYEQHIDGCEYGLDHDAQSGPKTIYDPSVGFTVSDDHIKDALRRANRKHKDPEYGKKKATNSTKRNNSNPIKTQTDEVVLRGKATLRNTDEPESSEETREPYLYQRYVDDVSDKDYDNVRIVKGNIKSIEISYNSVTIELDTIKKQNARLYFSESFKTRNEQNFRDLTYYQNYFNSLKSQNAEVFIACAGDVRQDEYEVSVYVESIDHLTINEMFHYDFLRHLKVI